MFSDASLFNIDISKWNVSNVNNMSHMFSDAPLFNIDKIKFMECIKCK